MLSRELDDVTLSNLQCLVKANFASRDRLYLAAESLSGLDRKLVCRRLADQLATNAIHIQQLLAQRNAEVPSPPCTDEAAKRGLQLAAANSDAVLDVAERCEQALERAYDDAIDHTPDAEATGIMRRQREDVAFGKRVLSCLRDAAARHLFPG